ncbi:MAG: hypothetical protein AAFY07_10655 [Pseudomonadota bacterium]
MKELILPAAMLIATAVCAFIAHRIYRSHDNWHIDGETKEARFYNWPRIGIFVCIGVFCAMTGYLLLI